MGHIHETRLNTRRNLFVAAQLAWENGSNAVRIRNISGVGALIEGDKFPHTDQSVRLTRGQQSAHGHLVWVRGSRAGMLFSVPITPDEWLPSRLKVRQGEKPIELTANGATTLESRAGAQAQRDLIIAEHLTRIRTMVEQVRLDITKDQSTRVPPDAVTKLDVIHRLLDWQVTELQP